MNVLLIPMLVSLVAVGALVIAVAASGLLSLSEQAAPAGKSLLRYSVGSFLSAIVFAWGAVPVCLALWGIVGEGAAILALWAGGPVGLILGLLLAGRRRAHKQTLLVAGLLLVPAVVRAGDWPQWRGPNRDGRWDETGVLETFPAEGLKIRWRAPVGFGWSSPVVAHGRVFLIDSLLAAPKATERVHCFDDATGKPLWTHVCDVPYPDWAFSPDQMMGPNATPCIDADWIYTIGCTGQLTCLDALKGEPVWIKNLTQEYGLEQFSGITASPLIEGNHLILVIGGKPNACVVAFDKTSGAEVWKALADPFSYSSPIVIESGGKRQLVVWTSKGVTSLDPATGKTSWREPLVTPETAPVVATPVFHDGLLLLSGLMLRIENDRPGAKVLWPEQQRKIASNEILSNTSTPLIRGNCVFSAKSTGELVCLDAQTGNQLWEANRVTDLKNGSSIHLTANGDSVLIYTDRGELIRARLTAEGYHELSRVPLLAPVYKFGGRNVAWSPPAHARRNIYARNQQELISASLAQP